MLELAITIYDSLGMMGSPDTLIGSMAMAALVFACLAWLLRWGYQTQNRILASNSQCAALAIAIPPRASESTLTQSLSWIDGSGRVFLNALPSELTALYKPNPSHQADKLFEIYRGKWIVTTFTIGDVEKEESTLGNSVMVLSDENVRKPLIAAMFDLKWKARLARLRKGDPISVKGQISAGNSAYIGLRNCELSESDDQF